MSRHTLALGAIAGCILGIISQVWITKIPLSGLLVMIACILITTSLQSTRFVSVVLAFFLFGFGYSSLAQYLTRPQLTYGKVSSLEMRVISNPTTQGTGIKFNAVTLNTIARTWRGRPTPVTLLVQTDPYPVYHLGDIISVSGSLAPPPTARSFNYPQILAHDGIFASMKNPKITVLGHTSGLIAAFHTWAEQRETQLSQQFSEPESSLLSAIILGDKASLSPSLKTTLSRAGMSHLVSIGGVTILLCLEAVDALWPITNGLVRLLALFTCIIALFIFTNGAVTVVRGGVFAVLQRSIRMTGRRAWPIPLLLCTALILLLWNPLEASNAGFQLSISAYAGLILLAPLFNRLTRNAFQRLISSGLAIAIATLPVSYLVFHQLSFWTILTSPLIYTLLPYILLLGIFYLLGAGIPLFATIIRLPLWLLTHTLTQTAVYLGNFGGTHA